MHGGFTFDGKIHFKTLLFCYNVSIWIMYTIVIFSIKLIVFSKATSTVNLVFYVQ